MVQRDDGVYGPNRLLDVVDIMLRRTFSSEDITGILGGNFFALAQRVWL